MALSIRDPETDRLARELSRRTGETMTQAIRKALEERLARVDGSREAEIERRRQAINAIVARAHKLPILDDRTADEILGYDENGLPT
ncbi:MAG TPA: type II toxin-antitoxin system VapB family antitoxin [Geminicoccaceae bacterium]|nr:type II toxin-antitoxin system VapB family antitoxin [Geminicoccus sp.]HMU51073.1 type II toxin-antitoxin system VapB family antitoxin [Geminicoccaceae bacterium]